jgi:prevent-host-death family protein
MILDMETYTTHEAKQGLSKLTAAAKAGSPSLITNNGKPIAFVMPITETTTQIARNMSSRARRAASAGKIGDFFGELFGDPPCTCGVSDKLLEDGTGQRDSPEIHGPACEYRRACEVEP